MPLLIFLSLNRSTEHVHCCGVIVRVVMFKSLLVMLSVSVKRDSPTLRNSFLQIRCCFEVGNESFRVIRSKNTILFVTIKIHVLLLPQLLTALYCLCFHLQDASVTAGDELSSSVSEDTGFGSAAPLPSDHPELCDLPDSQDPTDDLDPAPPPPPAVDSPPGSLFEEEPGLPPPVIDSALGSMCEEETGLVLSALDSATDSVCEEDVTLALKELDERCEEEEADFSSMSRLVYGSFCTC